MKRSEMLKKLYEICNEYTDANIEMAEDILEFIEKKGMFPPETVRYTDQSNGNTLCSPECSWDPEDNCE